MEQVKTVSVIGPEIQPYVEELARLRITVFSEWPYLYDGTVEFEREYLQTYLQSPECILVLAFHGGDIVGVSSGIPLEQEVEEFRRPFEAKGLPLGDYFYCAESVLLSEFRGQGIGHVFFNEREAHARKLGRFKYTTFCAVQRPDDHPLKPPGYRVLDPFWRKRGYVPRPDLTTDFVWKDLDKDDETAHTMLFWVRPVERE